MWTQFYASAILGFNKKLDEELGRFARRKLEGEHPYLILDARYQKVRGERSPPLPSGAGGHRN